MRFPEQSNLIDRGGNGGCQGWGQGKGGAVGCAASVWEDGKALGVGGSRHGCVSVLDATELVLSKD